MLCECLGYKEKTEVRPFCLLHVLRWGLDRARRCSLLSALERLGRLIGQSLDVVVDMTRWMTMWLLVHHTSRIDVTGVLLILRVQ